MTLREEILNDPDDVGYSAMTGLEIQDHFRIVDIPVLVSISSHDIKAYLVITDRFIPIQDSTTIEGRKAMNALTEFDSFDMNIPQYNAKLNWVLDDLAKAGIDLLNAMDVAYILSMGDKVVNKPEYLGFKFPTLGAIHKARTNA